ncbi:hypothetical protein D0T87_15600 [Bacteroides sp. 51]|nr:hypothetical protein [Bacteroides sp. 51]
MNNILRNNISEIDYLKLYSFVKRRSKQLEPIIRSLEHKIDKANIPLDDLLFSYIPMMLNRLFQSKNRLHKLIIYDFMNRHYTSEIAKGKYNDK